MKPHGRHSTRVPEPQPGTQRQDTAPRYPLSSPKPAPSASHPLTNPSSNTQVFQGDPTPPPAVLPALRPRSSPQREANPRGREGGAFPQRRDPLPALTRRRRRRRKQTGGGRAAEAGGRGSPPPSSHTTSLREARRAEGSARHFPGAAASPHPPRRPSGWGEPGSGSPHLSARLRPPERVSHGAAGGGGRGSRSRPAAVTAQARRRRPPWAALRMRGSALPSPGGRGGAQVLWGRGFESLLGPEPPGIPEGPVTVGRRVFVCFLKRACLFIGWWFGFWFFFEMGGGWLGRRDSGDAHLWPWGLTWLKGCSPAIKLLTPAKLLFAKASYQLQPGLKGAWNILRSVPWMNQARVARDAPGQRGPRASMAGSGTAAHRARPLRLCNERGEHRENTENLFVFSTG